MTNASAGKDTMIDKIFWTCVLTGIISFLLLAVDWVKPIGRAIAVVFLLSFFIGLVSGYLLIWF